MVLEGRDTADNTDKVQDKVAEALDQEVDMDTLDMEPCSRQVKAEDNHGKDRMELVAARIYLGKYKQVTMCQTREHFQRRKY